MKKKGTSSASYRTGGKFKKGYSSGNNSSRRLRSGRFGFFSVISLMIGVAALLAVASSNRTAGMAWGNLFESSGPEEFVLPASGFIVVDMSRVYLGDDGRELVHSSMQPKTPKATESKGDGLDEGEPSPLSRPFSLTDSIPVNERGFDVPALAEEGGEPCSSSFSLKGADNLTVEGFSMGTIGSAGANGGEFRLEAFAREEPMKESDFGSLISGKLNSDYDYVTLSTASDGKSLPAEEDPELSAEEEEVTLTEVKAQWVEHVVKSGETLSDIAISHNVAMCDIVKANSLKNPNRLAEKQMLLIPAGTDSVDATMEEVLTRKARVVAAQEEVVPVKVSAYVVAQGDSLWSIANSQNLEVDSLYGCNDLKNPDLLKPGKTLRIPNQDGIFYLVKKGDTLDAIAKKYGIPVARIKKGNEEGALTDLPAGKEIFLPGGRPPTPKSAGRGKTGGGKAVSKGGGGYRWPLVGKINSPFGWRRHPITRRRDFHTGIDIKSPRGRAIKVAKAGRVEYAGWMGGYGKVVVIRHNDGLSTLYAHCSTLSVKNGQSVNQGQVIAQVGTTGRTTGPHLHFEVRQGKSPTNPLKLLR